MTKFTDLTKEELIARIIEQYDPEIASDNEGVILHNMEKPDDSPLDKLAFNIQKGEYFIAPLDWNYYDNDTDLDWKWVKREEFRGIMRTALEAEEINKLRIVYKGNKYIQLKLSKILRLQEDLSFIGGNYRKLKNNYKYLEAEHNTLQAHYDDLEEKYQLLGGFNKLDDAIKGGE